MKRSKRTVLVDEAPWLELRDFADIAVCVDAAPTQPTPPRLRWRMKKTQAPFDLTLRVKSQATQEEP